MILASEIIREKNIYVLHGIFYRGAHYTDNTNNPENERIYSLEEKYNYIRTGNIVSAFTFNNNPNKDSTDKHLFSKQGFIIREARIIHADRDDSGIPRDVLQMRCIEPNYLKDMDKVIDSNRKGHNELLIQSSIIYGFYFETFNKEDFIVEDNGVNKIVEDEYKCLYTLRDIYELHVSNKINIYLLKENNFYLSGFIDNELKIVKSPINPLSIST